MQTHLYLSVIVRRLMLFIVCIVAVANANGQDKFKSFTALQIVQRAIDSAGGDKIFEENRNVDAITQIVTPKGDTLSFVVKRMGFNKYFVSSLSIGHVNTTRIYNNGKAVTIADEKAQPITDRAMLEDMQLQSFLSINYGYKKLGYALKRHADEQFQNFDCMVVMVTSPLGRTTLNFYDKNNGRLIMIIHPSLNKTLFIDYYRSGDISYPSQILMRDTAGAITSSVLTQIQYDPKMDSSWFAIPASSNIKAPSSFRTGKFKYVGYDDAPVITREKDQQTEMINGVNMVYRVKWTSDNDYLLFRLKNASLPPTDDNIEYIKTRIIFWMKNRYYCQYITQDNKGGTCAFEKID